MEVVEAGEKEVRVEAIEAGVIEVVLGVVFGPDFAPDFPILRVC